MGKSLKVFICAFFPSRILMFLSRIIQTQTLGRMLRTFVATFELESHTNTLAAEPF